nr:unnamed protein product [Callosobruchus analis]
MSENSVRFLLRCLRVYNANHPQDKTKRTDFLRKCAWELIKPQVEVRSGTMQLPRGMRQRAKALLGISDIPAPLLQRPLNYVRRCQF